MGLFYLSHLLFFQFLEGKYLYIWNIVYIIFRLFAPE